MANEFLPKHCYMELQNKPSALEKHCTDIINNPETSWQMHIGWHATLFPIELALAEPVLQQIHAEFPINRAAILKSPPKHNYLWHVDDDRGVTVNMLLSHSHHSHCLFGQPVNSDNFKFLELNYQPNTLYVFNTRFPHSVINFDGYRYLFSLEFRANKDQLSYPKFCVWAEKQGLFR